MTDSVQSLDSVIGWSHGKLWNVRNIRFKASKTSLGSYAARVLVDSKIICFLVPVNACFVKDNDMLSTFVFPMLKAWAWNNTVHTRSIISYMGIIAPINKIKTSWISIAHYVVVSWIQVQCRYAEKEEVTEAYTVFRETREGH